LLAPQVDTKELLLTAAADHSVRFAPGAVCKGASNCLRLSFSFYQPEELHEGARRLAAAVAAYAQNRKHAVPL